MPIDTTGDDGDDVLILRSGRTLPPFFAARGALVEKGAAALVDVLEGNTAGRAVRGAAARTGIWNTFAKAARTEGACMFARDCVRDQSIAQ